MFVQLSPLQGILIPIWIKIMSKLELLKVEGASRQVIL